MYSHGHVRPTHRNGDNVEEYSFVHQSLSLPSILLLSLSLSHLPSFLPPLIPSFFFSSLPSFLLPSPSPPCFPYFTSLPSFLLIFLLISPTAPTILLLSLSLSPSYLLFFLPFLFTSLFIAPSFFPILLLFLLPFLPLCLPSHLSLCLF